MHDLPNVYLSVHRGFCRRFGSRGFFISPCLAPAAWLALFNSIPIHLAGITRQIIRTCGGFSVCRYLASKHFKARNGGTELERAGGEDHLCSPTLYCRIEIDAINLAFQFKLFHVNHHAFNLCSISETGEFHVSL